jgi:hypothetical protein
MLIITKSNISCWMMMMMMMKKKKKKKDCTKRRSRLIDSMRSNR